MASSSSSSKSNVSRKKAAAAAAACSYLPEKLWKRIFKFLNNDDHINYNKIDEYGRYKRVSPRDSFKSLTLVSKEFLSITNSLRFYVSISDRTICYLPCLIRRFHNIISLKITLSYTEDSYLDELLTQISNFPLDLKSLTLNNPIRVPKNGLLALSKKMKNLTSFTCYQMTCVHKNDLSFIADRFPLLEELILTDSGFPTFFVHDEQLLALPKLRKIALARNFIGRQSINDLCKNCDLLQEVKVIEYIPLCQQSDEYIMCW